MQFMLVVAYCKALYNPTGGGVSFNHSFPHLRQIACSIASCLLFENEDKRERTKGAISTSGSKGGPNGPVNTVFIVG